MTVQNALLLTALALTSLLSAGHGSTQVAQAAAEQAVLAQTEAPTDGSAAPVLEPAAFLAGGPIRQLEIVGEHVVLARGNVIETWDARGGVPVGFEALPGVVSAFAIEGAGERSTGLDASEPGEGHDGIRRMVVIRGRELSVLALEPDGSLWTMGHHDGSTLYPGGLPSGMLLRWHRGIALGDGFVYLARTGSGFGDMRNDPVVLVVASLSADGSLDLVGEHGIGTGGVSWMAVHGDRLYGTLGIGGSMGSSGTSLWRADISRRHVPRLERLQVMDAAGERVGFSALTGLVIQDGHLLVTDIGQTGAGMRPEEQATLRVIDPTTTTTTGDPSQAREVARLQVEHVPLALALEGRQALVLTYESAYGSALREPKVLLRIDVTRVDEPTIVAREVLEHGAIVLAMLGDRVVLGTEGGDLAFYHLPGQGAPRLSFQRRGAGAALQVAADGTAAALLRQDGRGATEVQLLDVRDPRRPRVAARIADGAAASHVALRGGLLVVVAGDDQRSRLRIFDLADLSAPVERGLLEWEPRDARNAVQAVTWQRDRRLVVSSRDWLGIIDLSDPALPRLERSLQHGAEGGSRLAVDGERILVAGGSATRVALLTLDGDPGLLRRSIPFGDNATRYGAILHGLWGGWAWIQQGADLHLYAFEGPQGSPRRVRTHAAVVKNAYSRTVIEQLEERLLVIEEGDLRLYDIHEAGEPFLRQEMSLIGRPSHLAVAGSLVYAANGEAGLHLLLARPDALPWRLALPWAGRR